MKAIFYVLLAFNLALFSYDLFLDHVTIWTWFCAGAAAVAYSNIRTLNARKSAATFTLVYVESPYAGDVERNLKYVRAAMADCLARGEAPFASHALYTQEGVLDDNIPDERTRGIQAGFAWGMQADKTVVYTDLGISGGMKAGIEAAAEVGRPIEYRSLPGW